MLRVRPEILPGETLVSAARRHRALLEYRRLLRLHTSKDWNETPWDKRVDLGDPVYERWKRL